MLNLLPTTRKQTLRRRFITQQIQYLMGIAVIATSMAVAMIFVSDWLLQRWLQDITVATKADIITADERAELKILVNDLVQLVNQAQPIMQEQPLPLYDVTILLKPTPSDITLHEYRLDYLTHELVLTGTAATREALVAYQQQVKDLPGVKSVYSPLNDLTSKNEVSFTIQANYETPPVASVE